ncbi:MAG: hypothetical protein CM15mP95_0280 [Alphaproteobacteria bacterium]|nr:MAG: hypothetical protein CM15mP95_0280 [Alphaproteobacteria bacterium]
MPIAGQRVGKRIAILPTMMMLTALRMICTNLALKLPPLLTVDQKPQRVTVLKGLSASEVVNTHGRVVSIQLT